MRIALITREYPPETAWGGIGTFYFSFAKSLAQAGCDVEVFTQGVHKSFSEEQNGVLVHRILPRKWLVGRRPGGDLAGHKEKDLGVFAFSLAAEMLHAFALRQRQSTFHLVEGHEHLGINAFINACFKKRMVTLTRYHTAYYSFVRRGLANWPKSRIINYLERRSLLSADCRISPSNFIERITRQDFPGTPSADAIIPLSLRLIHRPVPPHKMREHLILFVGRLMPVHKKPDMVAQAFDRLAHRYPDWRVEFAGLDIRLSPEETMWQRCRKILAPHEGRFMYHGVLSKEQIDMLYTRARIIVVPSTFESFGLVALEAMALGCVPIVADDTALTEVVGDAGFVFRNGSVDDLVSKLEHAMIDEDELEQKSSACVQRIVSDFSESAILEMNLNAFRNAIDNKFGKRIDKEWLV